MAPEYGATIGFFPVDSETLAYLRNTGRTDEQVELVESYYKAQNMFRTADTPDPEFSDVIELISLRLYRAWLDRNVRKTVSSLPT